MPRGDPFTALCQQAAGLARRVAADLHTHTTASDGEFTLSQVVAFARAAKLDAVAVTDHDTITPAGDTGAGVAVIPGVELTAEWGRVEVHVLGYFPNGLLRDEGERGSGTLARFSRLPQLCLRRRDRFRDFLRLLREAGHPIDDGLASAVESATVSLGRRHVANLLVRAGLARNRREAWGRFVAPHGGKVTPKLRVPFAEATELICGAGGVSVLAHPPTDLSESALAAMKEVGLNGVETKFPAAGLGRTLTLNGWAGRLGLLTTGGSDCHGPDGRPVGSIGATAGELRAVCGGTAGEG